MSSRVSRLARYALVLIAGFLGACDSGTGPDHVTSSPTPTPTPQAVTSVVTQGTFTGLPPRTLGFIPFTTTASGTIAVTLDWTFASNDIDLFLVRGTNPCTPQQFNARTCTFLASAESLTAKPERVSVPGMAAGAYTFYAINWGTSDESIAYQATLTSVPGASEAMRTVPTSGGAKEHIDSPSARDMQGGTE